MNNYYSNNNLISCSKEDYSFYVKCDCGKEILQFYYYEDDGATGEPIIGINYFGHIDSKASDSYDRSVIFSKKSFLSFVSVLESDGVEYALNTHDRYFHAKRHKNTNYIHLIRALSEDYYDKGKYLWDIVIHDSLLSIFLQELNKIKDLLQQ